MESLNYKKPLWEFLFYLMVAVQVGTRQQKAVKVTGANKKQLEEHLH